MIKLDNGSNRYIESQNIKIFPCAYRGYYDSVSDPSNPKVFDPESRATTEANFANTFQKLSNRKNSYVVAWVPESVSAEGTFGTLKCVIGGYYIEIYNHKIEDFFYTDRNTGTKIPYFLCISTKNIDLGTSEPDATTKRVTPILDSLANSTDYLDIQTEPEPGTTVYVFTGLAVTTSTANSTASLAPFKADYDSETETYSYRVNPAMLPITTILDAGNGSYSIKMVDDPNTSGTNITTADGDYSVALGQNTAAVGKGSIAFGNTTSASGEGAVAMGNSTEASGEGAFAVGVASKASNKGAVAAGISVEASAQGATAFGSAAKASGKGALAAGNTTQAVKEGSVALGNHTTTNANNQVVIGKYNAADAEQAFIIANGTSSAKANKFTVSYTGDVKAVGNLEITGGTIKATNPDTNILELGTPETNYSGAITVYGTTEDEVFTVDNEGNTTIAKDLTVTGNSTLGYSNTTTVTVAGHTTINNGLQVNQNSVLNGALSVTGNVTFAATEGTTTNTLTLGSSAENISGALDIYGVDAGEDNKVFTVANTGKANTKYEVQATDSDGTLITKKYITDQIESLVAEDEAVAEGSTGKYLQSISQSSGKVTPVAHTFADTVVAGTTGEATNAPTSNAVATFVGELWTENRVNSGAGLKSLKSIILDSIYPVGAVYTHYLTNNESHIDTCPIANKLGGEWRALDAGRFPIIQGTSGDWGTFTRGEMGGQMATRKHSHSINLNATEGAHQHLTAIAATGTGSDEWTGFEGNSGGDWSDAGTGREIAGYVIEPTIKDEADYDAITGKGDTYKRYENDKNKSTYYGDHTHSIRGTTGDTGNDDSTTELKKDLLPPYVVVYMWRRIS